MLINFRTGLGYIPIGVKSRYSFTPDLRIRIKEGLRRMHLGDPILLPLHPFDGLANDLDGLYMVSPTGLQCRFPDGL